MAEKIMEQILVTGAAGFIGYHLSQRLLLEGYTVIGLDSLNSYYDVSLKRDRLAQLEKEKNFRFYKLDLGDRASMAELFSSHSFDKVVNLAAQAGVRYSLENPHVYADSNITGFINILEGCRHTRVPHLIFASSSSVYGGNTLLPFSVKDNVDRPLSLYAASKRANELMAYTYSHLYGIPITGLRFFSVYGPWGRPDMAMFIFTKAILAGQPIQVFNHGEMRRDFTYISDIVEGILRVMQRIPKVTTREDSPLSAPAYKLYNIGNNQPIELMKVIETLETYLGKKAEKIFLPLQPGDTPETYADVDELIQDTGFKPSTSIETGISKFLEWYLNYYSHSK